MIEKIGNFYYDKWKSGFDGNICGTKGIYPHPNLVNTNREVLIEYA